MGERSGKWGNVPGELVRGKCERIRGNLELSGKAEATQGGTLGQPGLIYRVPMHFKRNCYEELHTSCATDLRAVIRRFGDEPSRPQSPHSHGTRSLSAIDSLERAPRSARVEQYRGIGSSSRIWKNCSAIFLRSSRCRATSTKTFRRSPGVERCSRRRGDGTRLELVFHIASGGAIGSCLVGKRTEETDHALRA